MIEKRRKRTNYKGRKMRERKHSATFCVQTLFTIVEDSTVSEFGSCFRMHLMNCRMRNIKLNLKRLDLALPS